MGYKNIVWIVGGGRSGTTWLQESLNYKRKYRELFEPFHPMLHSKQYEIDFKYIRPENSSDEFFKLSENIFSGRYWHIRACILNRKIYCDTIIVKDIFSHLYLKWIHINFPYVKKILIIRNPFDVALSKIRNNDWEWMDDPQKFLRQKELYEDYLFSFKDLILSMNGKFERYILSWAIIHYVLFKQLHQNDIKIVFYENLRKNPKKEFPQILEFINPSQSSNLDSEFYDKIKKPSRTGFKSKENLVQDANLWKKQLNTEQLENSVNILERFGLFKLYRLTRNPDKNYLNTLLK